MKIEERIVRRNQEDVIEIGSALEKFYNGSAGIIVRAMANAITYEQFDGQDNHINADRKLGRAEGLTLLIKRIEMAIEEMNRLTIDIKEEQLLGG